MSDAGRTGGRRAPGGLAAVTASLRRASLGRVSIGRASLALVLAALALAPAACGKSAAPDPIAVKCKPHWDREMACADAEMKRALVMVGDICQKALNGKNPQIFGPTSVRRIERDLQCAIDAKDCAAYAACKAANDDDGSSAGDLPAPTLPR